MSPDPLLLGIEGGFWERDYHQEPRYKAMSSCTWVLHAAGSLFIMQIRRETACDNNYDYSESDDKCLV